MESCGVLLRENPPDKDKPKRVATNPLHGPAIVNGAKASVSQVEVQFFSNFSDTGRERRLISFDAPAGNLPWLLVHGLHEQYTSELIAEEAPGTDMLRRKGSIELSGTGWMIGETLLAHGPILAGAERPLPGGVPAGSTNGSPAARGMIAQGFT